MYGCCCQARNSCLTRTSPTEVWTLVFEPPPPSGMIQMSVCAVAVCTQGASLQLSLVEGTLCTPSGFRWGLALPYDVGRTGSCGREVQFFFGHVACKCPNLLRVTAAFLSLTESECGCLPQARLKLQRSSGSCGPL